MGERSRVSGRRQRSRKMPSPQPGTTRWTKGHDATPRVRTKRAERRRDRRTRRRRPSALPPRRDRRPTSRASARWDTRARRRQTARRRGWQPRAPPERSSPCSRARCATSILSLRRVVRASFGQRARARGADPLAHADEGAARRVRDGEHRIDPVSVRTISERRLRECRPVHRQRTREPHFRSRRP